MATDESEQQTQQLTAIDLFCGAGGFSHGLALEATA